MSYPALADLGTFIVVLSVGLATAYLFSKALRLNLPRIDFKNGKKQVWLCLVVFSVAFLGTFGIYAFYDKIWVRTTLTADPIYVLRGAIAICVILLPMLVALRYSRQHASDIAITGKSLGRNVAFGTLVSVAFIVFFSVLSPFLAGRYAGFTEATLYLLFSYVIIGLGEELVFRGYIQTRLVANNGSIIGITTSTALYALYNVPLGFFCYGGNVWLALVYGAWRLSSGLVYGYVFHRSQSIVPPIIVHIFLVWGGLLFSLYL